MASGGRFLAPLPGLLPGLLVETAKTPGIIRGYYLIRRESRKLQALHVTMSVHYLNQTKKGRAPEVGLALVV